MSDIVKAGLLVIRDGRMLLCRKSSGTSLLITPGGKIESGESDEVCLRRETAEELGPGVNLSAVKYVGTYRDAAAGADDRFVEIRLYSAELAEGHGQQTRPGEPIPHGEIAELVWFAPGDDTSLLSPSLRNRILPDLVARDFFAPPY